MNRVRKINDNFYSYDNSYFTSLEEINRYMQNKLGVTSPKSDEEVLEQMDIKIIENFLRKKKLEILNKK